MCVLYRWSKFSLAWHQSRSRALLLALKPVQVKGGKLLQFWNFHSFLYGGMGVCIGVVSSACLAPVAQSGLAVGAEAGSSQSQRSC